MTSPSEEKLPVDDYYRIADAIALLSSRAIEQPSLEDLAVAARMSAGHMQRTFQRWAGVSPKRFLQHLTVEHAKYVLRRNASASVLDAALESGLSGPSRLHDHFVSLEAATPGEYRVGGGGMKAQWGVHASPFGYMFLAVTGRGICALYFLDDPDPVASVSRVRSEWPEAVVVQDQEVTAAYAKKVFDDGGTGRPLNLLVRGTNFQIQVWRALLEIPSGTLTTYSDIARRIKNPAANRAVGSAVGANRISWLIPCHRVIRANGVSGSYRWGAGRKRLMNGWEAAQLRASEPEDP
jgi:AraC family transcriptional regulator of adaptative response/methylated-DNA-[protein]-cysteine methyltransferase